MAVPGVIHEILDRAAARWPGAPAVRDATEAWTYRELADASRRFAGWLHARGVRHGDRVLVRHPNAARLAAVVYGASRLGAVVVPVSPVLSRYQLRQVVADAAPALILTDTDDAGVPVGAALAQSAAAPPWDGAGAQPDDLALLMYTSGSTAAPKGVMCPHRQVTFAVRAIARRLRYGPDDAVFCRLPLSFDYGLYQTFLCSDGGSELLVVPDGNDAALLRWIRQWKATVVPVVPSLADMLVQLARRDRRPTVVRLFTNTGAALNAPLAAALRATFTGARVCMMFGLTECKRVSIMEPDGDLVRPGAVGRPLDGTRVSVVDPAGRELPPGQVGEFVVRGPHLAAGYWRADQLSRERFRPLPDGDRALHTGDFGYADTDGYLFFVGRRDDVFKRRGTRVSTAEIEAAALDVPGVRAAAVAPPGADDLLAVYAVTDRTPAEVVDGLRERLEPAKVPDVCHVVERLPVTANGKVDKAQLVGGVRC